MKIDQARWFRKLLWLTIPGRRLAACKHRTGVYELEKVMVDDKLLVSPAPTVKPSPGTAVSGAIACAGVVQLKSQMAKALIGTPLIGNQSDWEN